jgi:outer membrane protein
MLAAAASYNSFQEQVAALDLAFKATESRFNVGLLNSVDYNLAKVRLAGAQANLIQSKYNYLFRLKILDFYQNKPLSF